MQKVVTHNGSFHTDDVFAVATLQLVLGKDSFEIIRTRDKEIIEQGDIVVDVGGIYDPAKSRFDHHQVGAPVRDNGMPYAAFGLVWKTYGEQLTHSKEVFEIIDRRLVIPIDANDNGVSLYSLNNSEYSPVTIQDLMGLLKPVWGSEEDIDTVFRTAVDLATRILERSIMHATASVAESQLATQLYESALDKEVLVSDRPLSSHYFIDYPEVFFVVYPDDNNNWVASAVRKGHDSFETKVRFPEEWGGWRDAELANISGIDGAVFCHRAGFLFVASTQAGVLEAVNKVLQK